MRDLWGGEGRATHGGALDKGPPGVGVLLAENRAELTSMEFGFFKQVLCINILQD